MGVDDRLLAGLADDLGFEEVDLTCLQVLSCCGRNCVSEKGDIISRQYKLFGG